ncbi:sulfur carrier protein ThiS [Nocardioides sp. Y6]|uniref:Sulfur carrier protein ThiS n=1 Tax=Nocardioides malaquae TaxID=2773426 RepID=A0ABR9RQS7_9ACTN|nr:sulfur carrier protein ThiS [Nocardioides malaquae]MBE7323911.1 sulfur carrier protein ThiS [Nocardioides malaquae]
MLITLNGHPAEVAPGHVADLLAGMLPAPDGTRGVAVAVNGEVVPRAAHPRTPLHPGDVVDVVSAVAGG